MLADKPRRTSKYLMALGTKTPCVHAKWVTDSITEVGAFSLVFGGVSSAVQGKLLNFKQYMLSSGHSTETGTELFTNWGPASQR